MISFITLFFFNLPDHIWKMNYSLNLITGCDTLVNYHQPFEITGNVSFTLLWGLILILFKIITIQQHWRVFKHGQPV